MEESIAFKIQESESELLLPCLFKETLKALLFEQANHQLIDYNPSVLEAETQELHFFPKCLWHNNSEVLEDNKFDNFGRINELVEETNILFFLSL